VPAGFHHRPITKRSRRNAKQLRRDATDAETAMWQLLRSRRLAHFKFRRQVPAEGFILDFVCFDRKIVIAKLEREGFHVLRYWNNDVLQVREAILEDIFAQLNAASADPSPGALRAPPSPARGEGKRSK
jgi:very-short-patch-repair endonuclease